MPAGSPRGAGCKLATRFFNARVERGAGRVAATRLAYAVDPAIAELRGFRHIVTVHAEEPVGFFAYPGKPSLLKPDGCAVHSLCGHDQDPNEALEALASALGATAGTEQRQSQGDLARPRGPLDAGIDRAGARRDDAGGLHRRRRVDHHRPALLRV